MDQDQNKKICLEKTSLYSGDIIGNTLLNWRIRKVLPLLKGRLLDVGCGTGITTQFECDNYGLDPAIKLLLRHKEGKYVCAEAEHIPFKDDCFDHVVSITAVQNFHDIEAGIKEIKRVAKKTVVITALKKSPKISEIREIIEREFRVEREIEEEKDIVWVLYKV